MYVLFYVRQLNVLIKSYMTVIRTIKHCTVTVNEKRTPESGQILEVMEGL